MYQELHAKNPYLDNRQPSERRTHIQDYPKTYITRTKSAWHPCILNARHDWLDIPIRKVATTMKSASKDTNNQRETSILVYHTLVRIWKTSRKTTLFFSQFRLAGFVKQVVLLWPQNSFCPSKVTCRLLQQRSDKSQFRFAKEDNRVIMVTRYQ